MSFSKLNKLLSNPVVRAGIASASPQAALVLSILKSVGGSFSSKKDPSVKILLDVIDSRLAAITSKIANEKTSKLYCKELEIRLHEILGLLNSWEKRT